jgi:Subtilase family
MFPAAFPHVLSVSSMGPSGASSSFSTANGAVDVAAPGESVLTAVPLAFDDDGVPDGYERLDGTSFSSPIAAGAAAWLLAARPGLDGGQVADLLRFSAADMDSKGWDTDTGYGLIDLPAALDAPTPPSAALEVNDDLEWVNGTRFEHPDPFLFRATNRVRWLADSVDAWKDPADVYRIQIPAHRDVQITLRTQRDANPDLALFDARARTIYHRKYMVASSFRGPGRTDAVAVRNYGGRAAVGYVAVYAPNSDADRIDAPYLLTIRRLRR